MCQERINTKEETNRIKGESDKRGCFLYRVVSPGGGEVPSSIVTGKEGGKEGCVGNRLSISTRSGQHVLTLNCSNQITNVHQAHTMEPGALWVPRR